RPGKLKFVAEPNVTAEFAIDPNCGAVRPPFAVTVTPSSPVMDGKLSVPPVAELMIELASVPEISGALRFPPAFATKLNRSDEATALRSIMPALFDSSETKLPLVGTIEASPERLICPPAGPLAPATIFAVRFVAPGL